MVARINDSSDEPPLPGFPTGPADVEPIEDPTFLAGTCVSDNITVSIIRRIYRLFGFTELIDIVGVPLVKSLRFKPNLHPFAVIGDFKRLYGETGERAE